MIVNMLEAINKMLMVDAMVEADQIVTARAQVKCARLMLEEVIKSMKEDTAPKVNMVGPVKLSGEAVNVEANKKQDPAELLRNKLWADDAATLPIMAQIEKKYPTQWQDIYKYLVRNNYIGSQFIQLYNTRYAGNVDKFCRWVISLMKE